MEPLLSHHIFAFDKRVQILTACSFVLGDHVPDIIIIGFSTALFVLLLDVFVTVPVFFVVCVSCFPIGPFLSAGQPTNVSVNLWLIEPSGCHF